jgi:hypothetical protein
MPPSFLALVVFVAACSSGGPDTGDSAGAEPFCSTLNDGGAYETEAGGGNGTSGELDIRVLTSESTDPKDPLYVAFKDFTLQNIDSGGVKTTGKTSGDGLVSELLGAGNWRFSAAYIRGALTCLAEIDVPIAADTTTSACPVMACP